MGRKRTVKLRLPRFNHDPIENTKEFKRIEGEVNKKAKEICKGYEGQLGYCHRYWAVKERIFREEYNIEWNSPKKMNPGVIFD